MSDQGREDVKRLLDFEIVRPPGLPDQEVLELVFEDGRLRCLLTREMFLQLAAAFERHFMRPLMAFELFRPPGCLPDQSVLELIFDDGGLQCAVTREMLLLLSAAFERHVQTGGPSHGSSRSRGEQ